jgi:hypothetical protein
MSAQQLSLADFTPSPDQCEAYAERTGERCEHDTLSGLPYCPDHMHLYDPDVDGRPFIADTE